jgi:dihydrodipicolinate reductase
LALHHDAKQDYESGVAVGVGDCIVKALASVDRRGYHAERKPNDGFTIRAHAVELHIISTG